MLLMSSPCHATGMTQVWVSLFRPGFGHKAEDLGKTEYPSGVSLDVGTGMVFSATVDWAMGRYG